MTNVALSIFQTASLLVVWCLGLLFLGFKAERFEHIGLFTAWSITFGTYWFLAQNSHEQHLKKLLIFAVAIRLALVFAFPKLSDDIYRFIWDGRLLVQGQNPFEFTPAQWMQSALVTDADKAIFAKLNSPEYFTVYPLICQAVFYVSNLISADDVYLNSILIKLFLFFCEFATILISIRLLRKLNHAPKKILWYALNPLVIVEICGNAHFEAAMTAFAAAGLLLLLNKRTTTSALAFALSTASKMLTAITFPLMVFRELNRRRFKFTILLTVFCLLLSLPVFLSFNIFNSLDLYFRKFEYNAGLYYILRWSGKIMTGYNQISVIGPVLGIISTTAILIYSFRNARNANLPGTMMWIVFIYLVFATTVHPWYLTLLLFFGIFSNYKFPFVWSGIIFFTYINYAQNSFHEHLWLVAIEYLVVFAVLLAERNIHKTIRQKWNRTI